MRCSSVPIHTFVHARFSPLIWWDKLSVPHSVIERAVPVQITRREGIWPSSLAWTHGARRHRGLTHIVHREPRLCFFLLLTFPVLHLLKVWKKVSADVRGTAVMGKLLPVIYFCK